MGDQAHDLELTVLLKTKTKTKIILECDAISRRHAVNACMWAHLEAFVLEDFLDGDVITFLGSPDELCLENDTEGTVSNDLAIGVGDLFLVTGPTVGGDDFHDLVGVVDRCR